MFIHKIKYLSVGPHGLETDRQSFRPRRPREPRKKKGAATKKKEIFKKQTRHFPLEPPKIYDKHRNTNTNKQNRL